MVMPIPTLCHALLVHCLLGHSLLGSSRVAALGEGEDRHYRIDEIVVPKPIVMEVGGLLMLGDDDFLACTRRGEIWRVRGSRRDPSAAQYTLWAEGLQEPLGLLAHDGWVYCAQRGEVTRMKDTDGDDRADRFETVFNLAALSGNYHEYDFGPVLDDEGNLWITTNKPFGDEPFGRAEFRGWALRITPEGKMIPTCCGLRSPCGLAKAPWGDIFYTDNQGEWCGASKLSQLEPGDFHGHPHGLFSCARPENTVPDPGDVPNGVLMPEVAKQLPTFKLPAVWFPYDKMGQSPAGMVWDETGGGFGPFTGQVFVGDQHHSSVMRVFLEKIEGHWQGACFPFRDGFSCGVLRMAFDQDHSMVVGMTNRGWGSRGDEEQGLERLTYTGVVPFEVLEMRARPQGFHLRFTQPIDPATTRDSLAATMQSYTYKLHSTYGSDEFDKKDVGIPEVALDADGLGLELRCEGLRSGYVHELDLPGLRNTNGEALLHSLAYYTLIEIPRR